MTKSYLNNSIFTLFIFILSTSCNGQNNAKPLVFVKDQITKTNGKPYLVKTQGSTENDNVKCGLQDKTGNFWFGTTGEGVYRYDGKIFTQFTVKDGLINNCVYSILEDKSGNIWFGMLDGICRYNGKNFVPIIIPFSIRPLTNNNYYSSRSTKNTVWSMLQDKSGNIWFGTGDGVYCYNGITFTRFLNNDGVINKDSLHLKMVDCMLEDKNGNIWFASGMPPGEEGVCRFDGKSIVSYNPMEMVGFDI
jgi:ligand-binding sensor domain-containing protein